MLLVNIKNMILPIIGIVVGGLGIILGALDENYPFSLMSLAYLLLSVSNIIE